MKYLSIFVPIFAVFILLGQGCPSPVPSNVSVSDLEIEEPMQVNSESRGDLSNAGSYETYVPERLALADEGDVVLYFFASWCPTCQALERDIIAHLADIPENVTILKVDYDTERELKKKYGVNYQHTFVQVDSQGNQIKKWVGSPTLAELVAQVE